MYMSTRARILIEPPAFGLFTLFDAYKPLFLNKHSWYLIEKERMKCNVDIATWQEGYRNEADILELCKVIMEGLAKSLVPPSPSHHLRTPRRLSPSFTLCNRNRNSNTKSFISFCTNKRLDGNGNGNDHSVSSSQTNGADILEVPAPSASQMPEETSGQVIKLFNDAQQNILFLHKQRVMALEELKKVKREKEMLLASLGKLEAEAQSSTAECEVLKYKLSMIESTTSVGGTWKLQKERTHGNVQSEVSSILSEMLLRTDSMVLSKAISIEKANELRKLGMMKDYTLLDIFSTMKHKNDLELVAGLLKYLERKKREGLHIVQIASEMAPLTNAGSVGLHVKHLSQTLQRRNDVVEVILPKYKTMDLTQVQCLQEVPAEFYSYFSGQWHRNKIWTGVIYGIAITLVEPLHSSGFFDRELCYGYDDDFERFTYFCRASLDYLVKAGKQPDILHLHSWQTAAVAPLFWDIFTHQGLGKSRILFTCHNFKFQCVQEPMKLGLCGLVSERLHRPDRLQDDCNPKFINLLKGGIVYSNKVVTLSCPYLNSQSERENCNGLESVLSTHKDKVTTIPYGLDDIEWDPAKDRFLPSAFTAEDLSGKAICKSTLRQRIDLFHKLTTSPIVASVCLDMTLEELKIVKSALISSVQNGAQFVLMCISRDEVVNAMVKVLKEEFQENCRVLDKYDENLLHLLLAGSDILACTTYNDPLHQMPLKAIKYGAVPITASADSSKGSFVFQRRSFRELVSLQQLLAQMSVDPTGWNDFIKRMMSEDISWDADCAEGYIDAYWSIYQI